MVLFDMFVSIVCVGRGSGRDGVCVCVVFMSSHYIEVVSISSQCLLMSVLLTHPMGTPLSVLTKLPKKKGECHTRKKNRVR